MLEAHQFAIIIQAGGLSRRMGQDKALMPFLGKPLIAFTAARLSTLAGELLVTANQPEAYAFLGLPVYPDLLPGLGPLSGLYTALSVARAPVAAVVGCDMPFIAPALLAAEFELLARAEADAVIPRSPNGLEPLLAVYRRQACLPAVRTALHSGERKMTSWYEKVNVVEMNAETVAQYDPAFQSFVNINTPADHRAAEDLARKYCL